LTITKLRIENLNLHFVVSYQIIADGQIVLILDIIGFETYTTE